MLLLASLAFVLRRVPEMRFTPGSALRDRHHIRELGVRPNLLASLDLVLQTGETKGDFLRTARASGK